MGLQKQKHNQWGIQYTTALCVRCVFNPYTCRQIIPSGQSSALVGFHRFVYSETDMKRQRFRKTAGRGPNPINLKHDTAIAPLEGSLCFPENVFTIFWKGKDVI